MKPQAIRHFDLLYLGGYAVAIVGSFLGIGTARRAMTAAGVATAGGPVIYGGIAFSVVLALLLWYFISVRRSNVAKWIAVVLVLLGALSEIRSLTMPAAALNGVSLTPSTMALLLGLAGILLEGAGLSRLFTTEGKAWFAGTPSPDQYRAVFGDQPGSPPSGYGQGPAQPPYPPQGSYPPPPPPQG